MTVTDLYIHPIKSARRIALSEAEVLEQGLRWDRHWMAVKPDGEFLTGREHPQLTQVATALSPPWLVLSARGHETLRIPLDGGSGHPQTVQVWADRVHARVVSDAASAWLSAVLGFPCQLVRQDADAPRPVTPEFGVPGDEVSFADAFPLLLTCTGSLDDLNRRLAEPLAMTRFRPNVVVEGAPAWAEDAWRRIRIGEVEFASVKACARCVLTTIDPETGERHAEGEPLRTLSAFRRSSRGVLFGQNLIPRTRGWIRVGDSLEVLQ